MMIDKSITSKDLRSDTMISHCNSSPLPYFNIINGAESSIHIEENGFKSSIFDEVTPFEILMREEYSDVNLVIGSNIIAVHQIILACHSSFLRQLFLEHKIKDHGINEDTNSDKIHHLDKISVILDDFTLETVTKIVHFLYSGELISQSEGLVELQTLASALQMTFLNNQVIELKSQLLKEVKLQFSTNDDSVQSSANNIEQSEDFIEIPQESLCQDLEVHLAADENASSFLTLGGIETLGTNNAIISILKKFLFYF